MARVVEGSVSRGFGPVADAFTAAFAGRPAMGAALSVRYEGRWVVNLWGGYADPRDKVPWTQDTASVIFSCTKGLVSILAAQLVAEGRLSYNAPVARYWPEFAANGKAAVTVRDVLAHRAGLSAPDSDFSLEDALDWDRATQRLAQQAPLWPLGGGYAYHAITHGWLVGEVLRRASGMPVQTLFAERIARPLGVDAWIGRPATIEGAVAHLTTAPSRDAEWAGAEDSPQHRNWPLRAVTLGGALPAALVSETGGFNDPRLHQAEVPGAGGIATADALATIWSATVVETDGVTLIDDAAISQATAVQTEGPPLYAPVAPYARWGMGFQLDSPARRYLTPKSFGHDGAGGQVSFADPARNIGFAFLTNWMEGAGDDRATSIIEALRGALPDIDSSAQLSAKSF